MRKIDKVKDVILSLKHRVYTVNYAHRKITGRVGGRIYHDPLVECSKSTVRRALDELEKEGKFESYYKIGHCYDPIRWRRLK